MRFLFICYDQLEPVKEVTEEADRLFPRAQCNKIERPELFSAHCEVDHINPGGNPAIFGSRAAQADFNVRAWQGR
jgi:hypothetical protein